MEQMQQTKHPVSNQVDPDFFLQLGSEVDTTNKIILIRQLTTGWMQMLFFNMEQN